MEKTQYRVIRSKRKSMSLGLGDGLEVVVRAPNWMQAEYIERFVEQHRGWIEDKLAKRRTFLERYPVPDDAQIAAWMVKAKAIIPGRVEHFARIMGVVPNGIRYTKNRTRVGSCTSCNRLSFSCRLMRYPAEVLDYVVVHELAHIMYKNHGSGFWGVVAAVLPEYRVWRGVLRGD